MRLTEFLKIADILSKSHKIVVKEGMGWAANIQKREVFYRKSDIYSLGEDHILGLLLHEIAHIHYTTHAEIPKKNEEVMHSCMNMLEDIAIENIISGDYPNAGEILQSTETELLDTLVRMLPKMHDVSVHEKALLYAAVRFRDRGYAFGSQLYEQLGQQISVIMKAKNDEILNRPETKSLIPIATEIVDLLIKQAGQPTPEQKARMMAEAQGHTNAIEHTENDNVKKRVIQQLGGKGWDGTNGPPVEPRVKYIDDIADQADIIGKKLRSVLKRNNAMEFGGRYRTGKLMTRRLIKVKTTKDRRPFGRRIVKSNQSYAFAIASDVSGSMFHSYSNRADNGDYALTSMQMVGEALRKANVPRAMVVFGGNARVVAPMSKLSIRWDQMADHNVITRANQNNTNIDKAIDACTKELGKIRAERKIMIILTDGESDRYEMMQAHKRATEAGIECLGISLGNGYVMDAVFGKDKNRTIEDTRDSAQIGKTFIDILQQSIKDSA